MYSKTRDTIWVRCMFNFHTNVRRSNLPCFTDCTKHASAAALIHRQQTLYWLFTQTKLSSIYRNKPIVTYMIHVLGLDETWRVAYNLGETQNLQYFFFFYFSVARSSKACGKRRKTLKSWRGIYPSISSFLLSHEKAVNLLHLWNLEWRNVKFL